jgi:hypothetical protein
MYQLDNGKQIVNYGGSSMEGMTVPWEADLFSIRSK